MKCQIKGEGAHSCPKLAKNERGERPEDKKYCFVLFCFPRSGVSTEKLQCHLFVIYLKTIYREEKSPSCIISPTHVWPFFLSSDVSLLCYEYYSSFFSVMEAAQRVLDLSAGWELEGLPSHTLPRENPSLVTHLLTKCPFSARSICLHSPKWTGIFKAEKPQRNG